MHPESFRKKLLELAAEYESLHAGSAGRARPAVPAEAGPPPAPTRRAGSESSAGSHDRGAGRQAAVTQAAVTPVESLVPASTAAGSTELRLAVGAACSLSSCGGDGECAPAAAVSRNPYRSPTSSTAVAIESIHSQQSQVDGGAMTLGSNSDGRAVTPARRPSRIQRAAASLVQHRIARPHRLRGSMISSDRGSSRSVKMKASSSIKGEKEFKDAVSRTQGSLSRIDSSLKDDGLVAWIVKSHGFSMAIACLIVVSTVMIGIETQLLCSLSNQRSSSEQLISVLSATNYALTFLFTVEMAARLYVFRLNFFVYETGWNMLDVVILLLALVEVALELGMYAISGEKNDLFDSGGSAKVLRLFRLTRLLRLVRTFRQLKPLRLLLHSLYCAGKSVFWALLLLIIIVYSFGVILTQAVTEHTEGGTRVEDELLLSYYGNLYRSMLSLWWAVSGGISWYELTDPLDGIGNTAWVMLFLVYIAFVYFFILNVVTGVFCQNAIEGAQQDLELTIETQLKEKQMYTDRLRMLFREMNEGSEDLGEGLTAAEIQYNLAKPKVQSWFRALDVDAKQAWKLFRILDAENSGRVSLEDFVEGCLKLRGPATRVDVESLKWEIRGAKARAERTAERVADLIAVIDPGGSVGTNGSSALRPSPCVTQRPSVNTGTFV